MSKKQQLKKKLDEVIALGIEIWGEQLTTRYRCPEYNQAKGVYCFDSSEQPRLRQKYCPEHGKEIVAYQTPDYSTQTWQNEVNEYFYSRQFEEDTKK